MSADDSSSGPPVAPAGVLFRRRTERRRHRPTPWSPPCTSPSNPVVGDDEDARSITPAPGRSPAHVTMTAWAAAATAGRMRAAQNGPGDTPADRRAADNPTLIEASGQTRGFDDLLSVSDLPRDAFEEGFDRAAAQAMYSNFDLQGMLDGDLDDADDDLTPAAGEVAAIPGIHELSDLGEH